MPLNPRLLRPYLTPISDSMPVPEIYDSPMRGLRDVEALGLSPGLDRRLLRCDTQDGIGHCLIPCQTDAQCPTSEVCSGGVCEYIGCETSAECKTIAGLHDQVASDDQPWIPSVECR